MAISRWQPGQPVLSVRDVMNQLFDESIWWPARNAGYGTYQPPMDVYTDGDGYTVEVALPGLKPEDLDVQMIGDTLTISGEFKLEAPEGRQYLVRQRQGGRFQTSVTLPDAADAAQVTANFEHGVLFLHIPKSEAAKPKRIALKEGR
jgi:HSP20 family protein